MNLFATQDAPLLTALHGWDPHQPTQSQQALASRVHHTDFRPKSLKDQIIEAMAPGHPKRALSKADLEVSRLIRGVEKLNLHKALTAGMQLTDLLTPLHRDGAQHSPSVVALTAGRLIKGLCSKSVDVQVLRSKLERLEEAHPGLTARCEPGCAELNHLFFLIQALALRQDVAQQRLLKILDPKGRVKVEKVLATHLLHLDNMKKRAQSLLERATPYAKDGVILGARITLRDLERVKSIDLGPAREQVMKDLESLRDDDSDLSLSPTS